jgi:hypothetical protein
MHHRKLSNSDWIIIFFFGNNSDWIMIEERFQKKLSSWKGKLLSVGGWLVLINSVLTSLSMYMLSFFEVPRGILQKFRLLGLSFLLAKRRTQEKIQTH